MGCTIKTSFYSIHPDAIHITEFTTFSRSKKLCAQIQNKNNLGTNQVPNFHTTHVSCILLTLVHLISFSIIHPPPLFWYSSPLSNNILYNTFL